MQVERAAHCQGVRPGKARVFTCLLSHVEAGDYSAGCKEQLAAQQSKRVRDWRLDYDLRQACKEDVPKVIPIARTPPFEQDAAILWHTLHRARFFLPWHLPGAPPSHLKPRIASSHQHVD